MHTWENLHKLSIAPRYAVMVVGTVTVKAMWLQKNYQPKKEKKILLGHKPAYKRFTLLIPVEPVTKLLVERIFSGQNWEM